MLLFLTLDLNSLGQILGETAVRNILWYLEAWQIIVRLEKMGLRIQLLKWNYNAIYHDCNLLHLIPDEYVCILSQGSCTNLMS